MKTEKDIADIKAYCERLRADLSATNALLLSVYEALPVVYQEKVLPLVAARLAAREQLSGQPLPIEAERAMEQARHRWNACGTKRRQRINARLPR